MLNALWFSFPEDLHEAEELPRFFIRWRTPVFTAGGNAVTDTSPVALMTRLATHAPFAGLPDVLLYGALLAALFSLRFGMSKKLLALVS